MKRGSGTDWLMAGNPVVCWQGWQLQTLGGNSRFGNGGATVKADFLSLSFSKSLAFCSRGFFPIRESTVNADEFCMMNSLNSNLRCLLTSCEVFAQIKNTRFIWVGNSKGAFINVLWSLRAILYGVAEIIKIIYYSESSFINKGY